MKPHAAILATALFWAPVLWAPASQAQSPEPSPAADAEEAAPPPIEVSVVGRKRDLKRIAGSAHRIDEKELEAMEDDNAHRMLTRVAGVYVRGEDGYGLRPNIGMRGAASDRSKKITLLEDGILMGPAPYSAPAGYYFPLMTRMVGVEVFKGPSAILHGPNTIGGAINFLSRSIPFGHALGADIAAGSERYAKGHGHYGYGAKHWGVLIEGVRLRSDGFKELDGPKRLGATPNTGFDKTELIAKARINTAPGRALYSAAEIKLGYAREVSNETYLGLSDADFAASPLRRYAASQRDQMRWNRTLLELSHSLAYSDTISIRTTGYRHDFSRAWFKLNRFAEGPELFDVLADPSAGRRAVLFDVLTGKQNSTTAAETLIVGNNDRSYVSQGVQSVGRWVWPKLGAVAQRLRFGVRLHHDSIVRLHTDHGFVMRSGDMQRNNSPAVITTDNTGSTVAFSTYLMDEVTLGPITVAPGIRFENMTMLFSDRLALIDADNTQRALLPGVGILYQPFEALNLLAGVHQGFSPAAPSAKTTQPEQSVNYEAGARVSTKNAGGEVIGFFSDYQNLTGDCSFSTGCADVRIDEQFSGGKASIYGVEISAKADLLVNADLNVPLQASYTYTQATFRTTFRSDNPQWGNVIEGDELPYVPPHQLALSAGVDSRWAGLRLGLTFVDAMRERAGQGDPAANEQTDAHAALDAAAYVQVLKQMKWYLKVENLFNTTHIASRRPFGARPTRPAFVYAGVKIAFEKP